MWSNISEIKFPQTPAEAVSLKKRGQSAYFAGGTYLVAEKPPDIECLLDLNRLLTSGISSDGRSAIVGAGTTLQELLNHFNETEHSPISDCIRMSCASKNIRNQRTIGGEIAQGRPDSEILICFYALRAVLQAFNSESSSVEIGGWTNEGIIERVEIPLQDLGGISVQRFSTLKSVPGFVTAVGVLRGGYIDIAAGGKAESISCAIFKRSDLSEDKIAEFSDGVIRFFSNDQYGSLKYKKHLIQVAIKRIGEELC